MPLIIINHHLNLFLSHYPRKFFQLRVKVSIILLEEVLVSGLLFLGIKFLSINLR